MSTIPRRAYAGDYPGADAEIEAICRLAACRPMIDAIVEGRWWPDPKIISGIARIVEVAAGWARVAEDQAAAV